MLSPKAAVLFLCLFLHKSKEIKNTNNKSPPPPNQKNLTRIWPCIQCASDACPCRGAPFPVVGILTSLFSTVQCVKLCSGGVGLCSAFLFALRHSLLCSTLLCLLQAPLQKDLEPVFVVSITKGSAGQCQPQSPAYVSCRESGIIRNFL